MRERRNWELKAFFSLLPTAHCPLPTAHCPLISLLASENAFGLITAAHILTRQTRKEHQERYEAKLSLVRMLYNRHWDKQRVIDLFSVVDWMMTLPVWLETKIWQEMETIEEHKKMKYITSIERIGIAKGITQGITQGIAKGRIEGESKLLKRLLERRFGALPAWATEKLSNASESALEAWGEAILTVPTLDEVFQTEATFRKSKEKAGKKSAE